MTIETKGDTGLLFRFMRQPLSIRVAWASSVATFASVLIILIQVIRTGTDPNNTSAEAFVPSALTAFAVFIAVFGASMLVRAAKINVSRGMAWLIGLVSFSFAVVPWILVSSGHEKIGALLYRGLRIPQGIERFWDMALVLRSVDCDALGFNVFIDNNGCIPDAAIYGPGMLWLHYLPFQIFSFDHVLVLGILAMAISSLSLVWLAKQSSGLGQIVLLIAAMGAPWLLLLERGNIDAALLWIAVGGVFLVRRYPQLWAWSLLALAIWVAGTWKYYPFAMGLMLIPLFKIRRGWIVIAGWTIATLIYVISTWGNFKFSMQSNTNMIEIGDYVVLGRVPVVARMFGSEFPSNGLQLGDLLVALLALAALVWGVSIGMSRREQHKHVSMLAAAGSAIFLASVLVGGFGWAYKATFLLLCIPLFGWLGSQLERTAVAAGFISLGLVAVSSIVVWNTLLASLAGIVAASFGLGLSLCFLLKPVLKFKLKRTWRRQTGTAVPVHGA